MAKIALKKTKRKVSKTALDQENAMNKMLANDDTLFLEQFQQVNNPIETSRRYVFNANMIEICNARIHTEHYSHVSLLLDRVRDSTDRSWAG